jgi:ubiquinone/menaquinone biosynthesis C-methylase UbiE
VLLRDTKHKHCPERLAFLLNNPLRRRFGRPEDLISKLNIAPEHVVVDFGCGPGYFTVPLARIAQKVIAVDVSSAMLDKAAAHAKGNGLHVELIQADGTRIDLADACADEILLVHVFHEVEFADKVLGEFLRVLKPLGRLIIVEKTRGSRLLGSRLGPPIVSASDVKDEISRAGFNTADPLPFGNDSIIIGTKP